MRGLTLPADPRLLVGLEGRDDAGVYRLNDDTAIIQTVDFFTPMVDDPYVFGQIAAVNALNDIYAMGGAPLLAMNLVMFPECGDFNLLRQIIEGGLSKISEAGALLVGGHSVDDNEPKYGLAVTGLVHPQKLLSNNGARPGDRLFLTKPLGSGVISTAIKAELADPAAVAEALAVMTALNKDACEAMQAVGVNAATDITGFGLLGHCYELCAASGVTAELFPAELPFIRGVADAAAMGLLPAGAYNNRDHFRAHVDAGAVDPDFMDLLFSPETAGGLLIAVDPARADALRAALQQRHCLAAEIGRLLPPASHVIGFGV